MLNVVGHFARKKARNSGPGLAAILATWADYCEYNSLLQGMQYRSNAELDGLDYLAKLEADGICIVENFWSEGECAHGRDEVDRIIEHYPKYVNGNAKADQRVYGANNASKILAKFASDAMLASLASA